MMHHRLTTALATLALGAIAGCSGRVDVASEGERTSSDDPAVGGALPPDETNEPSSAWEISHAVSQGALQAQPLSLRAEDTAGRPVTGAYFCSIHDTVCGHSDVEGRVELAVTDGRQLITGYSEGFARSALTVAGANAPMDLTDIAYQLHTVAALDAVYAAGGATRDRRLGTVVLELTGARAAGVQAVVMGARGEHLVGAYVGADGLVTSDLGATSERGLVYLLNMPPGSVTIELSRDGEPCAEVDTAAWRSAAPSAVDTMVVSGGLTFAGFVGCS